MKIIAVAKRILQQMFRDKRTLALLLLAPILLLTLIYLLLDSYSGRQAVALVSGPLWYQQQLEESDVQVWRCTEEEGWRLLEQGEITAIVQMVDERLILQLDGSNANAQQVLNKLVTAQKSSDWQSPDLRAQVHYVFGYDDLSMFDQFGSALIGILVFFLVFLIAGISFVQERTTGTLEKLLATPIKRWEIVLGYVLGFGLITLLQSILITVYVVYGLHIMLAGSVWLVLFITLLSAVTALTLGILLSTAAHSEFQMVQFIPIVIVPQIFLSGIFDLSGIWEQLSYFTPIYYIADSLHQVMLKGAGFIEIADHLFVLFCFSVVFLLLNVQLLKKQRSV